MIYKIYNEKGQIGFATDLEIANKKYSSFYNDMILGYSKEIMLYEEGYNILPRCIKHDIREDAIAK